MSRPTIAEVEIDYRAYDEPLVAGHYNGKPILHNGRLCAKWRSPEREMLAAMMSVRCEPAPEDLDAYAARLVEGLADQCSNSVGIRSTITGGSDCGLA